MPTPPRPRPRRRAARLLAAGALTLGGLSALPATPATARAADTGVPNGDTIANLWEWNWKSVAAECTDVLDPAGYGAVQVAPPAESLKAAGLNWWDVYQPYSYGLNSRFGTERQFRDMVATCHGAGVKVYVDAVINHTSAQPGTGYGGTKISNKYDTPDWDPGDYHQGDDCEDEDLTIDDWSNLSEVQNCELLGLPDLETEEENVRKGIAGYLNKLTGIGVDGYRVDAAKHIPAADLAAIEGYLEPTSSGAKPYVFQEVYPGATPTPGDYYGTGDVLDFTYASKLKDQFRGDISNLETFGESWGFVPADKSATFVTNHDTDRNGYTLGLKDGAVTRLANIFQLGRGYGTPSVYASFTWSDSDGAPPNADGFVTDTDCSGGWTCLDRDAGVKGAVAFHNATDGASYTNFQAKSSDVIGFSRGDKGFMALNNTSADATYTFATNLADGTYENVIDGGASSVTVSGGSAEITVPAMGAVAIHR
ncbi:alpha-amylase [Streptomyces formicae]|uniref:Alpha-amylase n=1 Tax=Streptomyces formicae TaxID=1616117 RepID=A0A291Q620_9ACTN|nr:alpha-amylase family protein [Streptomyces formicae]ATL27240.1 Alpha-amylase precursor (1,4-alpha-D-glucan glucanohydrolase) [Streptomyces formicae]